MRLLYSVVFVLFFGALLLFMFSGNMSEWVTIHLNGTHEFRLVGVVLISVLVGALTVGMLALIEGASVRLANRRLRKEIHQLETELNYLRTQPSASAARQESSHDAIAEPEVPQLPPARPASAPDYAAEGAWDEDESDDVYSGQRGV